MKDPALNMRKRKWMKLPAEAKGTWSVSTNHYCSTIIRRSKQPMQQTQQFGFNSTEVRQWELHAQSECAWVVTQGAADCKQIMSTHFEHLSSPDSWPCQFVSQFLASNACLRAFGGLLFGLACLLSKRQQKHQSSATTFLEHPKLITNNKSHIWRRIEWHP